MKIIHACTTQPTDTTIIDWRNEVLCSKSPPIWKQQVRSRTPRDAIDVDVVKLRAQANASMPASYNSNIQLLILILQHVMDLTTDNSLLDLIFSRDPDMVDNVQVNGNF